MPGGCHKRLTRTQSLNLGVIWGISLGSRSFVPQDDRDGAIATKPSF